MSFSKFLASKHDACKTLVKKLSKHYQYVSLLGTHVTGVTISVSSKDKNVTDTPEGECGFVIKLYNGKYYSEYSFSDFDQHHIDKFVEQIIQETSLTDTLASDVVKTKVLDDTPLTKTYFRPVEGKPLSIDEVFLRLDEIKNKAHAFNEKIIQVRTSYTYNEFSKMFISKNRDLCQNYAWCNAVMIPIARDGDNVKSSYHVKGYNNPRRCLEELLQESDEYCQLTIDLLNSELIKPGVYDIVCEPSITGLIAHEAFGHGVEMDMFVKNRALAKEYVGKRVASPLVNMHDGADATLSAASYFFDDDGVLASDTLIIKDGILQTGISDVISASILGTKPTGNGRRESYKRKAYTRMTNTFFSPGEDKVEDMIKSIKYGYLLAQTDNGMEDPKNWNIQCVCAYGREIKDGQFTGKIVAPVVMSGYVPDLLNSITMVSDTCTVIGSGHCGKGYKEWVMVSDGGPYIKARCKLG